MISVCIPVYNFNITELFKTLYKQLTDIKQAFEFVIIDDDSEEEFKIFNRIIRDFDNTNYIELDNNVGRSKIRNLLIKEAMYDHLLIMDCDSQVESSQYISQYIHNINGEQVVCGGRSYLNKKPKNKKIVLRWLYGKTRESRTAAQREIKPYQSFMTNNFLIPKKIFDQCKFDESLIEYGHEDTLFGYELNIMGVTIKHINNPLTHIGLENNIDFINKTKHGIDNLMIIVKKYPYEMLWEDIKILKYLKKVKKLKVKWIFKTIYYLFNKLLLLNLMSRHPSIKLFDLYKLCYISTIN